MDGHSFAMACLDKMARRKEKRKEKVRRKTKKKRHAESSTLSVTVLTGKLTDAFGSITITNKQSRANAMWFTTDPNPLHYKYIWATQPPGVEQHQHTRAHN